MNDGRTRETRERGTVYVLRCNLGKFTFPGDNVLVPSVQSKLMTAIIGTTMLAQRR